jgi:hypothetical protein
MPSLHAIASSLPIFWITEGCNVPFISRNVSNPLPIVHRARHRTFSALFVRSGVKSWLMDRERSRLFAQSLPLPTRGFFLLFLAASLALTGCMRKTTPSAVTASFTFDCRAPAHEAVVISNPGKRTATFTFVLNGEPFFGDDPSVHAEVLQRHSDLSFRKALWTYLRERHLHADPLTQSRWAHSPALYLNSLGFGYCDDSAAVFHHLARIAGYESRIWNLEGHVVGEIRNNERWEMCDVDGEVYYLDASGATAGVEELSANPKLITEPAAVTAALPRSRYAKSQSFSPRMAAIYASSEDNRLKPWSEKLTLRYSGMIELPAGASITFPGIFAASPASAFGAPVRAAQARLRLPSGWTGRLISPLVFIGFRGRGSVQYGATALVGNSTNAWIPNPSFEEFGGEIVVNRSASDLDLVFLIHPRFRPAETNTLLVSGAIDSLECGTVILSETERLPSGP